MTDTPRYWMSEPPTVCDLDIRHSITTTFIDGRVRSGGGWAIMCPACHAAVGVGLGLGRGQKYSYVQSLDKFRKIDG